MSMNRTAHEFLIYKADSHKLTEAKSHAMKKRNLRKAGGTFTSSLVAYKVVEKMTHKFVDSMLPTVLPHSRVNQQLTVCSRKSKATNRISNADAIHHPYVYPAKSNDIEDKLADFIHKSIVPDMLHRDWERVKKLFLSRDFFIGNGRISRAAKLFSAIKLNISVTNNKFLTRGSLHHLLSFYKGVVQWQKTNRIFVCLSALRVVPPLVDG